MAVSGLQAACAERESPCRHVGLKHCGNIDAVCVAVFQHRHQRAPDGKSGHSGCVKLVLTAF
jgi:hypothetical protein